ncbi:unnamed protein product [Darwinula stevensoni]|uniref:EGF-like domain-containing protein n=1 Tax=Darwinula stevensoni TaxID=69355 RepID=A0A7R8X6P8_9CRUS|nr:unnamed protein product [Darwinula stevensoni]CAG0885993.1 unnamed protein product [Darwinula stevensoni]
MVDGAGVLEVRVTTFINAEAKDADGQCCQPYRQSTGVCRGVCRTFFRACATVPGRDFTQAYTSTDKERHAVDPNAPCSIGVIVTDVVANNSLESHDEGILDIKFPFDFPWTKRVAVIIESWHDVTGDLFSYKGVAKVHDKLAKLIARVTVVDDIEPGQDWTLHWYKNENVHMDYALRVSCKKNFAGADCTEHHYDEYHHHMSHEEQKHGHVDPYSGKCICPGPAKTTTTTTTTTTAAPYTHSSEDHHKHSYHDPDENKPHYSHHKHKREVQGILGEAERPGRTEQEKYVLEKSREILYAKIQRDTKDVLGKNETCAAISPELMIDLTKMVAEDVVWAMPDAVQEMCNITEDSPWASFFSSQDESGCQEKRGTHFKCSGKGERICQIGWTGDMCDVPICKNGCDPLHGYCQLPGECTCKMGWTGDLCRECMTLPGCVHGICEEPWQCRCKPGWDGLFCSQPVKLDFSDVGWVGTERRVRTAESFQAVNTDFVPDLWNADVNPDGPGCFAIFLYVVEDVIQTMATARRKEFAGVRLVGLANSAMNAFLIPGARWELVPNHGNALASQDGVVSSVMNVSQGVPYSSVYCKVQTTCKRYRECQTLLNLTELNYCETHPGTCLNGGTCESLTKEEGDFKCLCPEDYKGLQCQEKTISSTNSTGRNEETVFVANESENFVKRRFG